MNRDDLFLIREGSKRAIRMWRNAGLHGPRVDEWFSVLMQCLADKAHIYGKIMQIVVIRCPPGNLVAIAINFSGRDMCVVYLAR